MSEVDSMKERETEKERERRERRGMSEYRMRESERGGKEI